MVKKGKANVDSNPAVTLLPIDLEEVIEPESLGFTVSKMRIISFSFIGWCDS